MSYLEDQIQHMKLETGWEIKNIFSDRASILQTLY